MNVHQFIKHMGLAPYHCTYHCPEIWWLSPCNIGTDIYKGAIIPWQEVFDKLSVTTYRFASYTSEEGALVALADAIRRTPHLLDPFYRMF